MIVDGLSETCNEGGSVSETDFVVIYIEILVRRVLLDSYVIGRHDNYRE